jgi:hypothetical protein
MSINFITPFYHSKIARLIIPVINRQLVVCIAAFFGNRPTFTAVKGVVTR